MAVITTLRSRQQNAHSILLTLMKLTTAKRSEQGLTLMESLMAMLVTSTILLSMSPLILLEVGTRLQNYRTEQAIELAQSEIDRIQVEMSQGVAVSEEAEKLPPADSGNISGVNAPTATVTDRNQLDATNKALEVDIDDDGDSDFLVQIFRDQGIRFDQGAANGELAIFKMGVRVYSIVAKENLSGLETEPASLSLTRGLGDQRFRPLAVLQTEMSRSDLQLSLSKYEDYLTPQ